MNDLEEKLPRSRIKDENGSVCRDTLSIVYRKAFSKHTDLDEQSSVSQMIACYTEKVTYWLCGQVAFECLVAVKMR